MKNLFISLCCVIFTIVSAQEKNTTMTEVGQKPDWKLMLAKLDTTQIKSGVLIDKVTSFADLLLFNTEKNNTSSKAHFIQAISELYRASNKTKFIDVDSLKAIIKTNTSTNQVLVGIINSNFEKLNFSETKDREGGLTVNNGSFDTIAGKSSFLSRKVFVASPAAASVTASASVTLVPSKPQLRNIAHNCSAMIPTC